MDSADALPGHILDLPADLSLAVLSRLEGWDLVAACAASIVWSSQVATEELWRKACEARWPLTFGRRPEAEASPLAMPVWLGRVSHFRAPRRVGSMVPPAPGAPLVEWRAYYLEHDLHEALNVGPAFLKPEEFHQLHTGLARRLRRFSHLVNAVAIEGPQRTEHLGLLCHLRHLSVAHTPRGGADDGVEPTGLLQALRRLNQSAIKRLRLLRAVDTLLQPSEVEELLQSQTFELTHLELSSNPLGPGGAGTIAAALCPAGPLPSLVSLVLVSAQLGDEGARQLGAALAHYPSLTSLDLAHNNIGAEGVHGLAPLLRLGRRHEPGTQTAMEVDGGGGGPAGGSQEGSESLAGLRVLRLSHNPLGETAVLALAAALQTNRTLQSLVLQYVNCNPAEQQGRLEPFPLTPLLTGSAITALDMCHNHIAACGGHIDQLREALESNMHLRTLSLRRCCIGGWRRARAIARGLALNRSLTSVDLSYNGIGAASSHPGHGPQQPALSLAVESLCQALRHNRQLRSVGLAHNCLGDRGGCAVLQAALDGGSISTLDLASNEIGVATLGAIAYALRTLGVRWLPAAPQAPLPTGGGRSSPAGLALGLGSRRGSPVGLGLGPGGGAAAGVGLLCDLPPLPQCARDGGGGGGGSADYRAMVTDLTPQPLPSPSALSPQPSALSPHPSALTPLPSRLRWSTSASISQ